MKRFAALMLVLSLTGCRTFIQNEFVDVPNYDVDPYEAPAEEVMEVPAPEVTYLRDQNKEAYSDFEESCVQTHSLFDRESEDPYWTKSIEELLASDEIRSALPQFETELDVFETHFGIERREFILNAMCDFNDQLYLGLLAGEMGEYLFIMSLDEHSRPTMSEVFGGLYDGSYYLAEMDLLPNKIAVWLPFGDAGHVAWRVYSMTPKSLEWEKVEDCGLSYFDENGESTEEHTLWCDLEFTELTQ